VKDIELRELPEGRGVSSDFLSFKGVALALKFIQHKFGLLDLDLLKGVLDRGSLSLERDIIPVAAPPLVNDLTLLAW
jgi:hypothetical protein